MSELFLMLSQLLEQLASPDNQVRNAAESQLNSRWLDQDPILLLQGLAAVAHTAPLPHRRSFAAVLLRRIAVRAHPSGRVF